MKYNFVTYSSFSKIQSTLYWSFFLVFDFEMSWLTEPLIIDKLLPIQDYYLLNYWYTECTIYWILKKDHRIKNYILIFK